MTNSDIVSMYSRGQMGGELPYFVGKQYGSSWFRSLSRFAIPILRRLGLTAAKAATGALAATATDVLTKKAGLGASLKANAMAAAKDTLPAIQKEALKVLGPADSRKRKSGTGKKSINKRMRGTIFQK